MQRKETVCCIRSCTPLLRRASVVGQCFQWLYHPPRKDSHYYCLPMMSLFAQHKENFIWRSSLSQSRHAADPFVMQRNVADLFFAYSGMYRHSACCIPPSFYYCCMLSFTLPSILSAPVLEENECLHCSQRLNPSGENSLQEELFWC